MRVKLTYPSEITAPAEKFAEKVLEWQMMLNDLTDCTWGIEEMKKISASLTELCIIARKLPRVNQTEDEEIDDAIIRDSRIDHPVLFDEKYRHYYTVFFPYDGIGESKEPVPEPVMGDLVDDIYDISYDLSEGLEYFDHGMIYRAIFVWRLSFLDHWGEHASQALYAMDHAIRKYVTDDDMGKHDNPADVFYYPVIAYNDLDHSFLAHVSPVDTRLPYEILINSLGSDEDDIPMVGVAVNEKVIFVSICEEPEILSRVDIPAKETVLDWVKRHRVPLKRHWKKELTDCDVLIAVSEP